MTAPLMTAIAKNDAGLVDMTVDIGVNGMMIQYQFSTGSKPIAQQDTVETGHNIGKNVYNFL